MKSETSFELHGDLIWVEATVVGPTGRAAVDLVLDTAAVFTTLAPPIADSIGCTEATAITRTVTRTAAANEHGYLVRLVELSTLGITRPGLAVNVADLGYGVDGLLGMNFLVDYNIEIRPGERRILIEKI